MDIIKIKDWINNPDRNYKSGIELLSRAGGNKKEIQFFYSGQDEMRMNMLVNKLQRILRIQGQKADQNATVVTETKKGKVIIPKKIPQAGRLAEDNDGPIIRSKKITNKLLTFAWDDLNRREKEYFNNDKSLFLTKKDDLNQAIGQRKKLSHLHLKLKNTTNEKDREEIANKLVNANRSDKELWNKVDDFSKRKEAGKQEAEKVPEATTEGSISADEAIKLNKRLMNVRTYITKAKKDLPKIVDTKKKNKKKASIKKYEQELRAIQNKLNA